MVGMGKVHLIVPNLVKVGVALALPQSHELILHAEGRPPQFYRTDDVPAQLQPSKFVRRRKVLRIAAFHIVSGYSALRYSAFGFRAAFADSS